MKGKIVIYGVEKHSAGGSCVSGVTVE